MGFPDACRPGEHSCCAFEAEQVWHQSFSVSGGRAVIQQHLVRGLLELMGFPEACTSISHALSIAVALRKLSMHLLQALQSITMSPASRPESQKSKDARAPVGHTLSRISPEQAAMVDPGLLCCRETWKRRLQSQHGIKLPA